MNKKQLEAVAKRLQQQEQQIKMLVNLLLDVLNEEPDARNKAENFIFIQTTLYELINEVEGDWEEKRAELAMKASELVEAKEQALEQERKINELKEQIVEMELRHYE